MFSGLMIAIFCVIKCMRAQQSTFQSIFDIFILIDGIQTDRDAGQIVKLFGEFWKRFFTLVINFERLPMGTYAQ